MPAGVKNPLVTFYAVFPTMLLKFWTKELVIQKQKEYLLEGGSWGSNVACTENWFFSSLYLSIPEYFLVDLWFTGIAQLK